MRDFIGAHEKDIRRSLEAFRAGEPVYPIQMELFPTEVCNHGCSWCVSAHYRGAKNVMDWDYLQSFLRSAAAHGLREIHICGGGEPLVYRHIEDLLRLAADLGLGVLLYTNGSRRERGLIDAIASCAFEVRVSFDAGTAEMYSRVRSVPLPVFDHVQGFISDLVARRGPDGPRVVMSFVGDAQNAHTVPDYLRVALGLGVDEALLKTNLFDPDDVRQARLDHMVRLAKETLGTWPHPRVRAYDAPLDRFGPTDDMWALAPLKAVVHTTWDIYPCCHSGGQARYSFGNVLRDGFEQTMGVNRLPLLRQLVDGSVERCVKCVDSRPNRRAIELLTSYQMN